MISSKRQIYIASILAACWLLVISLAACDVLTSIDDNPEEPQRTNPSDPKSDSARPPAARITNWDTTRTVEINQRNLTIRWKPDTGRVSQNIVYQYRLLSPGQSPENTSWPQTGWASFDSTMYTYLDESFHGTPYTFQVRARSQEDTTLVQETPTNLKFTINAITDRGIAFFPRSIEANSSGEHVTELWLDEIESTDSLAVIQAEIGYPQNQVAVEHVEIFTDSRSLLKRSDGEITDLVSVEESAGRIVIHIAVLGGDTELIEGAGHIGKITFSTASSNSSPAVITMQPESALFNAGGSELSISEQDLDTGIFLTD